MRQRMRRWRSGSSSGMGASLHNDRDPTHGGRQVQGILSDIEQPRTFPFFTLETLGGGGYGVPNS